MGRMQVVLLREWAGYHLVDVSWGWLNLPSGGSLGGGMDVVTVAVAVIMPKVPGSLGPWVGGGGVLVKQDASVKSVGFPTQLWWSGLVLGHHNVGSKNPGAPDSTHAKHVHRTTNESGAE